MDGANQPISDLYYALDMAIEALEQTEPQTITIEGKMSLNEWRKICPENPQFKDEPQTEEWHDDCNTCRWHEGACTIPCCDYEPKTELQTDIGTSDTVYSDTAGYVPRVDMTDCSWQKGE